MATLFTLMNFVIIGIILASYLIYINIQDLPDYNQLKNYEPPIVTRFYAADGKLLEEYAKEHRLFVPINAIPKELQQAFIAAEDKNFYDHPGIDFFGITRAVIQNIINISQNKKNLVGGSTITQQVVKNFLLTNEKTLSRKIKEAVLSFRITNVFSKDKILELYLNQIYLGSGAYGVASAALTYFNKSINELSVEESALLAALPKAPNNFSPKNFYDKATIRRNWVLERMYEEGYITYELAKEAASKPIKLEKKNSGRVVKADFFAESVRRGIAEKYSEKALYEGGLYIKTTLDPVLQKIAETSFRNGLIKYDQRRGYRGVVTNISLQEEWQDNINKISDLKPVPGMVYAIVEAIDEKKMNIKLKNNKSFIAYEELKWAMRGNKKIDSRFKKGDMILVEKLEKGYALRQVPKVNGGLVVMDPHLGRVLAMVGGFDFQTSKYNRADQAYRQPGSSFKPFVYLTGLENGYTPSSIIVDGPIEIYQGPGLPLWRPRNYYRNYLGPTTLRRGLELSRNTMTINLAQNLGIDKIVEIAQRFGINKNPSPMYSMVLGSMETSLINMVSAYSMVVNGGYKITPSLIEKIQDRNGKVVFTHDSRGCDNCYKTSSEYYSTTTNDESKLPDIIENREVIIDAQTSYQFISLLEGVVQHTNGAKIIRDIGKTLGGKTGTTNNNFDAWFIGFSPDLVVGTYVGHDDPKSLGDKETGTTIAIPIFAEFMKEALKNTIDVPFRIPEGIKLVKVDYETGKPSMAKSGTIYEAFKEGTEPEFVDSDIQVQKPIAQKPKNEDKKKIENENDNDNSDSETESEPEDKQSESDEPNLEELY